MSDEQGLDAGICVSAEAESRSHVEIVSDESDVAGTDSVHFYVDGKELRAGIFGYEISHYVGELPVLTLKAWMPTVKTKVTQVKVIEVCPVCGTEKATEVGEGMDRLADLTEFNQGSNYRHQYPKDGLVGPTEEEGDTG